MASDFSLKGSMYMIKSGNTCTSTLKGLTDLNSQNYWLLGTNLG